MEIRSISIDKLLKFAHIAKRLYILTLIRLKSVSTDLQLKVVELKLALTDLQKSVFKKIPVKESFFVVKSD